MVIPLASNVDISNLATPDQLDAKSSADISGLPTHDQLGGEQPEPSLGSSMLTMGEKGLTGGLTGVAAGVGAAAGALSGSTKHIKDRISDYLHGDNTAFDDIGKAYQEGLIDQNDIEAAAQKAHPIAGKAAELIGNEIGRASRRE